LLAVPLLLDCEALLGVPPAIVTSWLVSSSIPVTDVAMFMVVVTCWNSASCVTNWVPSVGFEGSWFSSSATRSCKKESSFTVAFEEAEVPEVELVAGAVLDVGVVDAIAGVM
jgi:hypothetical protein